jgi:hypothetical protein
VGIFDTKTQTLVKKNSGIGGTEKTISTFAYYNNKIYVIDAEHKKIYRHNATSDGFDQGEVWIKTGESRLGGVIAMAIDGDLYALKNNGEVRKWYRGEEQTFNLAPIDPILNSANAISLPENGDELFILDSTNKRIAIFDKNGEFREQITAEIFKNPTAMAVADKGKTIFVLDGTMVYKVSR